MAQSGGRGETYNRSLQERRDTRAAPPSARSTCKASWKKI